MKTNHMVVDKNGQVHKRSSHGRVYSHAVVVHWKRDDGTTGSHRAEWRSTGLLARDLANTYLNKGLDVEILEAEHPQKETGQ